MTIGIIEDDSLLNQALEIALQNAGYYTISAHTRKEALDLLREKVMEMESSCIRNYKWRKEFRQFF